MRIPSAHLDAALDHSVPDDRIAGQLAEDEQTGGGLRVREPEDIVNAVVWLVSDAARSVTEVTLPVDAGFVNKR